MSAGNFVNMKYSRAFTLIELLISMAILITMFSLGLFVSFDFYQSYAFGAARNDMVSILQKARSQSQNNINQTRHGVHFQNNPSVQYVLFACPTQNPECTSYIPSASDMIFDSSYAISFAAPTSLPADIIFDQLDGNCVTCQQSITLRLQQSNKYDTITINGEGQIDY